MKTIRLIHDVLDNLLVDRDNVPLGRVDGIVLLVAGDHSQPRVAQIESGIPTLARRLSGRLSRVLQWLALKLGMRRPRPVRLPWSRVEAVGKQLKIDICAENSRFLARERWLRDHLICHIPGSSAK
ncbi:MAG: hypothetical protein ABR514_11075 [Chthoniobacterales bacterium]